jgi:DNA polymerase-3 subunit chi
MTRVDFAFGASSRLNMACHVVHKHYKAGRRLLVYSRDQVILTRFDRMLWRFDPAAFVPHVHAGDALEQQTPVILVPTLPYQDAADDAFWLLNLDSQAPDQAGRFQRVLEIVSGHDADRQAARRRWRAYEEAGYTLRAFDVSARQAE